MTTNERIDAAMSTWLHEDAAFRVPAHLDEVLAVTSETRQRPAWSSLERWLPVDTTFRPRLLPVPPGARLLMAAALILLALVVAIVAVGSRQQRLPEPFGLARNGIATASADGDIFILDPTTLERGPLITDDNYDFGGHFSRDGTRIMFLRARERPENMVNPALILTIADADGSDVRELTPAMAGLDWSDWSPDGSKIAFLSRDAAGIGFVNVVDVETGARTTFDLDVSAHFVTWRPPHGEEILLRGEGETPGIYAISVADGSARRINRRGPNNQFDFQSMTVSPDGHSVSFTQWSDAGLPRVHVMDVDTAVERVLPTPAGMFQRGGATFSPDGVTLAYVRIVPDQAGATAEVVIAPVDGSGEGRVVGPRIGTTPDGADVPLSVMFTPDGTAVIARYGTDLKATVRWLPIDGSDGRVIDEGEFGFVDMQRLAP